MTSIKFIITALVATIVLTTSVLANPVPAATTVVTVPGITLPFATLPPFTVSAPAQPATQTTIVATHLEKRVCNEWGCGMKCKGTANTPCNIPINSPSDCAICTYFKYAPDGTAKLLWDRQCLNIQFGVDPPLDRC